MNLARGKHYRVKALKDMVVDVSGDHSKHLAVKEGAVIDGSFVSDHGNVLCFWMFDIKGQFLSDYVFFPAGSIEAVELTTNLTKQDLLDQREQIQEDLMCVLDGLEERVITNACQIIVDRFVTLITKLEERP